MICSDSGKDDTVRNSFPKSTLHVHQIITIIIIIPYLLCNLEKMS